MLKKILLLSMLLCIFSINVAHSHYVTAEMLNVRSTASTQSKILNKLPKGKYVTVLENQGNWSYIEYTSNDAKKSGWVYSKYLSLSFVEGKGTKISTEAKNKEPEILEISKQKLTCDEDGKNGGLTKCRLNVTIDYRGKKEEYTTSQWIDCNAKIQFTELDEKGNKSTKIDTMKGIDSVYKNAILSNSVTLNYYFPNVRTKAVRASASNVSCVLKLYQ